MASRNALRCLLWQSTANPLPTRSRQTKALFSTSSPSQASKTSSAFRGFDPLRKRHQRPGSVGQNQKRIRDPSTTRHPEPGQRKAFKKRIQLSNDNALAVGNLGTLKADSLVDPSNAGQVLGLPVGLVDQLRAVQAFRPGQSWRLFRSPHFLVRDESLKLGEALKEAGENKDGALRMVVTGEKQTGKSVLLLQGMAHAFMNKWVVIHIPEAQSLTNAHTDYAPVADTDPMRFTQPSYTANLLQDICKANGPLLHTLFCARDYSKISFLAHLPPKPTLQDLASSVRELEFAWPTFLALWTELTRVPGRPPVMFCLEGLQYVMQESAYRDPSFNKVHAHELTLVRTFVDALSGKAAFVNGGAVLAVSGGNDTDRIPSLDLALSQITAGSAGAEVPEPDPWEKGYDDKVYDAVKDVKVLRVGSVTKAEARGVMEYWARSGMLMERVTEPLVSTRWTLGGHGVLGEMEKASLLRMRY